MKRGGDSAVVYSSLTIKDYLLVACVNMCVQMALGNQENALQTYD